MGYPSVNLNFNGQSKPSRVVATASGYDILHNWYVQSGRFLSDADGREARTVAVIGSKVKEELFGDTEPIGKEIKATRRSSKKKKKQSKNRKKNRTKNNKKKQR